MTLARKEQTVNISQHQAHHNQEVVVVRAGKRNPQEVFIWREDLELLNSLGLSSSWSCLPSGYVMACASRASGNHVMVARVLLDCHAGQGVRYRDGNPRNLRRENLKKTHGSHSCRRDRDYIKGNEV